MSDLSKDHFPTTSLPMRDSLRMIRTGFTTRPVPLPAKPWNRSEPLAVRLHHFIPHAKTEKSTGRSAFMVGAGILISRIVGLARQRVFAHYFGTSAAGDAFSAAFRIPNFLQNIFGEGALSASFIPCLRQAAGTGR